METLVNGNPAAWTPTICSEWVNNKEQYEGKKIVRADRITRERQHPRVPQLKVITESFTYMIENGDQFVLILSQREETR